MRYSDTSSGILPGTSVHRYIPPITTSPPSSPSPSPPSPHRQTLKPGTQRPSTIHGSCENPSSADQTRQPSLASASQDRDRVKTMVRSDAKLLFQPSMRPHALPASQTHSLHVVSHVLPLSSASILIHRRPRLTPRYTPPSSLLQPPLCFFSHKTKKNQNGT